MGRENLKLVSIRLNEDLIKKIDNEALRQRYWKRSDIIRDILTAVFDEMSERDIYNMIRYPWYRKNVVNAKFEITKELKPNNRI